MGPLSGVLMENVVPLQLQRFAPLSRGDCLSRANQAATEFLGTSHGHGVLSPHVPTTPDADSMIWSPPPPNVLKINCDGSWSKVIKCMGLGVVVRNAAGSLLQ